MQYLVSDYFATGEGRCISILITQKAEKLEAAKDFLDLFGDWYLRGAENISHEEFWKKYHHYVPTYVKNLLEDVAGPPGAFNYYSQMYINFA